MLENCVYTYGWLYLPRCDRVLPSCSSSQAQEISAGDASSGGDSLNVERITLRLHVVGVFVHITHTHTHTHLSLIHI